jgi:hypothetical protein
MFGSVASAAPLLAVPLGTSADFAVLGASTVTNTGNSVIDGSVGLWAGTAVTGFPPGVVTPPGTIQVTTTAAQQAQADLTTAFGDAAGRSVDTITPADLANQDLTAGVYSALGKPALSLSGPLTLDGGNDPTSVFIFQTNATLTTASNTVITLINGAQECNVFWEVGDSATLGTTSDFAGNILAQNSITVTTGVTVHGRALARAGAVTLDTDLFLPPTCANAVPTTTTTVPAPTTTTVPAGTTTSTVPAGTTTSTVPAGTSTSTVPAATTTTTGAPVSGTTVAGAVTTTTDPFAAGTTTSTVSAVAPIIPVVRTTTPGGNIPAVAGPPQTGGSATRDDGARWSLVLTGCVGGLSVVSLARRMQLKRALASCARVVSR